jgi:hypothetical protein
MGECRCETRTLWYHAIDSTQLFLYTRSTADVYMRHSRIFLFEKLLFLVTQHTGDEIR